MVLFLAFSLQDQVEKYGAYVGIAAFFGLAVLTLLYFSQARELRRLRDWAGRAPERAQELEARVAANAQAARTVQAVPRTAAPAAVAATTGTVGPATAAGAAAAAGAAPATQVIERPEGEGAEEGDAPESDGAGPEGADGEPGAGTPVGADGEPGAETPVGAAAGVDGSGDSEPNEAVPPAVPGDPEPGAPAPAVESGAGSTGGESGDDVAPVGAPPPPAVVAPPAQAEDEDEDDEEDEDDDHHALDVPAPPIPRATPVPRRALNVPAAPLRQPSRSATLPPRRSAPPAPRRSGAGEGRRGWLLPAGLGILIVAAVAFGATQLLGGDDGSPSTAPEDRAAQTPTAEGTPEPDGSALTPESTRVAVLNGTTLEGLAARQAEDLRAAGFTREITTGNNTEQRVESSVHYADGARAMARQVGGVLDIGTVQAQDADTRALGEGADVVVILGQDKAP